MTSSDGQEIAPTPILRAFPDAKPVSTFAGNALGLLFPARPPISTLERLVVDETFANPVRPGREQP
jgi:hypothetical protein